ncbi:MAG: hypothetical protein IZT55_00965 [Anaerolineae bacterium]|nr:hypothetical protein [Anaerolineae bacterium]
MKKLWKMIFLLVGAAVLVGFNWAMFSGILLGIPDEVKDAVLSSGKVRVENWEDQQSYSFYPAADDAVTGVILYPEGNLDARLYAPLAQMIAEGGYQVVILSRRFERGLDFAGEAMRMNHVMAAHPTIENWVVGGVSWSSVLPVDFALKNTDKVDAVILLAARIDEETSMAETELPVLYVYGTRDDENEDLLNWQYPYLPAHTVYGKIDGGNRLQYGYTGPMARDVGADISVEEQQRAAADHMIAFLEMFEK